MFKALLVALFLFAPLTGFSEHHAKVENLSWLTGSWDGQLGPNVLEENWSLPRSGSIASLVRQTGPDGMGMIEMVFIEEANGTLELHLQQWDSGFSPRSPAAQKMTMADMTENSVTFRAVGEGGLAQLKYSRPSADEFNIDVRTMTDQEFTIKLKPQSR
jgi:hypothetical protein